MMTKADIFRCKINYYTAKADAISAKTQMVRSVRERATSPAMLLAWFTFGWRSGRDMMRTSDKKPKSTLSKIRPFITMLIMRMF